MRPSATRFLAAAAPQKQQKLRLLIIGGGPSAFYSAARVLSHYNPSSSSEGDVEVHMCERLPAPHGLVRYGVAPDHPEVKNVEHKFAEVAQDPRFMFFGNVNVSDEPSPLYPRANHVPLASLLPHYTHVLFAYGSSKARELGIPGSAPGQLQNVHSALDFVNWYNGHPVAHDPTLQQDPASSFRLSKNSGEHATVVGAGNVALDVARILLRSSCASALDPEANTMEARAELARTDIPEPVLAELSASRIRRIDVFARRGPAQLAFTNKELREMMALPRVAFSPSDSALLKEAQIAVEEAERQAGNAPEAKSEARVKKRLLSLLAKGSQTTFSAGTKGKSWGLNFFRAPAELHGDSNHTSSPKCIRQVTWNVTKLPAAKLDPSASLAGGSVENTTTWGAGVSPGNSPNTLSTGKQETTQTDLLISSIGYRSEQISCDEPFDSSKAIVPNDAGRVMTLQGTQVAGQYVSGWLARGPVGVIASTMYDAYSVADLLVQDHKEGISLGADSDLAGLPAELARPSRKVVTDKDWTRLDELERERGAKLGKLREKILTVQGMLEALD